jgi:Trypsin-like peptidase domain
MRRYRLTTTKAIAWPAAACVPVMVSVIAAVAATAQSLPPRTAPTADGDDDLRAYAGHASWRLVYNEGNRTWVCRGEGSAMFLGGNRFLTAAHVTDQDPFTNDCADFGRADPVVEVGSTTLRARVVKSTSWVDDGGLTYPGGVDLALVEVEARMMPVERRSTPSLGLCDGDLPADADVQVVTEYGVFAAKTQPRVNDEFARIDLAGTRGNSGGGVVDPARRCLVGIVSNGGLEGTNVVSSETIRRFLALPAATSSIGEPVKHAE